MKNSVNSGEPHRDTEGNPELRACTKCSNLLPLTSFVRDKAKKSGYTSQCKECRASYAKYTRKKDVVAKILAAKKHISKVKGLPYDLDREYLESIQTIKCPVLGIDMVYMNQENPHHDANATLDRVIPSKGYTKGNVVFISFRANRLKADATLQELQALVHYVTSQSAETIQ